MFFSSIKEASIGNMHGGTRDMCGDRWKDKIAPVLSLFWIFVICQNLWESVLIVDSLLIMK